MITNYFTLRHLRMLRCSFYFSIIAMLVYLFKADNNDKDKRVPKTKATSYEDGYYDYDEDYDYDNMDYEGIDINDIDEDMLDEIEEKLANIG